MTVPVDPWTHLSQARRQYADALAARERLDPGSPGYREAVHRLGIAWAAVQRLQREVAKRA